MNTPVAFIIFNRPDTTERVFAEIAKAKPPKLLVIADGPRENRVGEAEKCAAARAVVEQVDWKCEVLTNYSDVNLGCKKRVSSGLDWVFENCEEAIVLEDDCLPDTTFFPYCDELLDRYRYDERVMVIGGSNVFNINPTYPYSYYFSYYNFCWGWASWRRAWRHYDVNMTHWPTLSQTPWLHDLLSYAPAADYWSKTFQKVYEDQIETWAFRWTFSCWTQSGFTTLPQCNLISNIGFRDDATHPTPDIYGVSALSTHDIKLPLQHPPYMLCDREADQILFDNFYARESQEGRIFQKVIQKIRRMIAGGGSCL